MTLPESTRPASRLRNSLSRRALLRQALVLGVAVPAVGTLLAACGGDDDEPTATTAAGTTPTTDAGTESTPTEAMAESTPTEGMAAETPTEGMDEEPTPTSGDSGAENPRWMGLPIEPAQNEGGVIVEAGGTPDTVNPVVSLYNTAIGMLFERLVDMNIETFEPVGNLASAWEVSDDGLVWTVTVRDGVFWHDGEPLTADDVKFSWDAHMSDIGLEASYITEVVESIEVVDETTVAFNNLQATVDFPIDYLFWFAILPMHIWESVPTQDWITDPGSTGEDPSRVVGTGPFKFQEFVLGDFITLTRNEEYWDGVPHLDQYISQETEDTSAVVSQLLAGEIDFAEDVDPGAVNALDAEQFDIFEIYAGYLAVLIFNLREDKTTLFQDTAVRKAMMYAMNREEMIEAADFGYAEIPLGVMAPGAWMTIPEEITVTYSYDPDQAAALFEEAGWVLGDDGIREKDGQQLAFTILAASGNTREEARLAIVQEQLRQVGVAAEIQTMDGDLLYERTNDTWDFEVVLDYYYMGFTPENSFLWACGADDVGNHAGYCNPEVDQLFDDGRATADREERARIYTQIQNLILEDLPALPLAVPFAIGARNLRTHNMYPAMPSTAHFAAETWWVDA